MNVKSLILGITILAAFFLIWYFINQKIRKIDNKADNREIITDFENDEIETLLNK